MKDCDIVPLEAALEWAPGRKQPSSGLIIAVSVDRWAVLLLLDAVQVLEEQVVPLLKMKVNEACFSNSWNNEQVGFTTYQPAFAGLQTDCAVAVHGGLEKFLCSQVPKEHNANPGSDGENVALERH